MIHSKSSVDRSDCYPVSDTVLSPIGERRESELRTMEQLMKFDSLARTESQKSDAEGQLFIKSLFISLCKGTSIILNFGLVERSGQMDLESSIRKFQEMNKQLTLGTDVTEETHLNSTSSLTSIDQKLK